MPARVDLPNPTDEEPATTAERLTYLPAAPEPEVRVGSPLPLGAHIHGDGVNFAVVSRHATRIWLELYDRPEDGVPARSIELAPARHRTGDVWHCWLPGVGAGQLYAYRADGPYAPQLGHRFNPHKLLLDPRATALTRRQDWDFDPAHGYDPASQQRDLTFSSEDDAAAMPKCVVTRRHISWEEDRPLDNPWPSTVIYEAHVRGLTIHPSAGVAHPGTYRGLIDKIPYLQDLGVTAIEILPVQEFNEDELRRRNPITGEPLRNYWGYSPVSFFAPKASYSSAAGPAEPLGEFREMVHALHQAGIEVILDVVFNHTAEGNELGPTLSFRGLDNSLYYILQGDGRYYQDDTGTGNTVNANHPIVRDLILDALRHWVVDMHVDGFRFDLASVLGRDEHGKLLADPPLLERIAEDPILREVKLIAEAWDAAGAYQVGSFSERRWAEWNGRYRDDVRRFWRGDDGMLGAFASRLCGSADIYERSGKGPESSINLITCHDGFTLNDLVSYERKHNEANGEGNRDGAGDNYSSNYGIEGETGDPEVEAVRRRQIKNLLLTLFVSRGVPMLLGGDEFRRTQRGNNNAYCQDNATSWIDWTLLERHREIHRFTRGMIAFRREHTVLSREAFYTAADIRWLGSQGGRPRWEDAREKCLGCLIYGAGEPDVLLLFNAGTAPVSFRLPPVPDGRRWSRAADTSLPSPEDLAERDLESQATYPLGARASAILISPAISCRGPMPGVESSLRR